MGESRQAVDRLKIWLLWRWKRVCLTFEAISDYRCDWTNRSAIWGIWRRRLRQIVFRKHGTKKGSVIFSGTLRDNQPLHWVQVERGATMNPFIERAAKCAPPFSQPCRDRLSNLRAMVGTVMKGMRQVAAGSTRLIQQGNILISERRVCQNETYSLGACQQLSAWQRWISSQRNSN